MIASTTSSTMTIHKVCFVPTGTPNPTAKGRFSLYYCCGLQGRRCSSDAAKAYDRKCVRGGKDVEGSWRAKDGKLEVAAPKSSRSEQFKLRRSNNSVRRRLRPLAPAFFRQAVLNARSVRSSRRRTIREGQGTRCRRGRKDVVRNE